MFLFAKPIAVIPITKDMWLYKCVLGHLKGVYFSVDPHMGYFNVHNFTGTAQLKSTIKDWALQAGVEVRWF